MWAGVIALADQYARHNLGFVNAAIYRIARGALYGRTFHDVTRENNSASFRPSSVGGYQAEAGWDPATGWGSPNANVLVPLIARGVDPNDARGI